MIENRPGIPDPVHDAGADAPVELPPEARKELLKSISDIRGAQAFLASVIESGLMTRSIAETHLGLLRHHFEDLAEGLGSADVLSRELEARTAELREANRRIRGMEAEAGHAISPAALSGGLRHAEDVFRSLYERAGWHYASIEYLPWGLHADFSEQMSKPGAEEPHLASEPVFGEMAGIPRAHGLEISWDAFSGVLIDTPANRNAVMSYFLEYLPKASFHEFKARIDRQVWGLRFDMTASYEDLLALYERETKKPAAEASEDGEA